jgi:hypothetical protein
MVLNVLSTLLLSQQPPIYSELAALTSSCCRQGPDISADIRGREAYDSTRVELLGIGSRGIGFRVRQVAYVPTSDPKAVGTSGPGNIGSSSDVSTDYLAEWKSLEGVELKRGQIVFNFVFGSVQTFELIPTQKGLRRGGALYESFIRLPLVASDRADRWFAMIVSEIRKARPDLKL